MEPQRRAASLLLGVSLCAAFCCQGGLFSPFLLICQLLKATRRFLFCPLTDHHAGLKFRVKNAPLLLSEGSLNLLDQCFLVPVT